MARVYLTTAFEMALFALAALDLVYVVFSSLVALFCMESMIQVPVIAKLCWAVLFLISISVAACMVLSFLKKDFRYYWPYRAFLALRMIGSLVLAIYVLFLLVCKDSNDQLQFGKYITSAFCSDACLDCTGGQQMGRLLFWAAIFTCHAVGILFLTTFAEKDLTVIKGKQNGEAGKHLQQPMTDE